MRFKDEKHMWFVDTEILACELENKSKDEIQNILDQNDVITLKSGDRPNTSILGRTLFFPSFIILTIMGMIKWIITGDRYIDSLIKKYSFLKFWIDFVGIK
jgi:hypothetical protein